MKISVVLCAAICLCGVVGATFAAAARSSAEATCVVTGATWKLGSRTGMKYTLVTRGTVTCAFGTPWVARLSRAHLSQVGGTGALPGGPAGWSCRAMGVRYYGTCYLTANPGQAFAWKPKP